MTRRRACWRRRWGRTRGTRCYSGDTNNDPATENGANEGVTIVQASPALVSVATATAGGVVGTVELSDAATLSGGDSPTGTISFSLTAPDGTTTPEGSVTVTGDGVYDSPSTVLATEVGKYTWHAMYSGDTNNDPATDNGANEGVTIAQTTPALVSVATATAGGVVGVSELSDTATLSGGDSPTGTISFTLDVAEWYDGTGGIGDGDG